MILKNHLNNGQVLIDTQENHVFTLKDYKQKVNEKIRAKQNTQLVGEMLIHANYHLHFISFSPQLLG